MKHLIICIVFLIFTSCIFKPCSNITGKYRIINSSITNILTINSDGTYLNYYSNGSLNLNNKGYWRKSEIDNCIIELTNYKNFNELGEKFEVFAEYILYIDGKYLNITPDGEDWESFVRIDK